MRTLIKGGVWKNTEDEILKAAVSKYGKNQWARISSLLVRKTPKQCKARWFEWLDPSIKKTEWSKEEDEKLLHLAKLMPTQWRTIAPIVGRTPAQCLERYQRLLDEAEAKDGDEEDEFSLQGTTGHEGGPSADDVRKLRPGEIDPEPETKPARPDPVDMDEDEKEMLSEARARLANTQGKKAKRKARERQLEEARRLTSLQKRRELKAAGITMRVQRKKRGGMDYNADIPFEKPAPLGFYDVTEENSRTSDASKFTNIELSKVNRRRADIEEEKKREQEKKRKDNKGGPEGNQGRFVPAKDAKILKIQEQEQIAKRRKLVLPAPQVGEQELEEIVKAGFAGESAKSLVQGDDEATATQGLVSDYVVTPGAYAARTPRVAAATDTLAMEARNLRALNSAQTPLLGEENMSLHLEEGTGFEGALPKHASLQTPNPLATPRRGTGRTGTAGAQTPFKTPMRDHFKINEQGIAVGETPREEKRLRTEKKRSLSEALMNLPKPRNEWEIRLPDLEEQEASVPQETETVIEDMSEVERKRKEAAQREEQERQARRSLAVQMNLPRPAQIPKIEADAQGEAEHMVHAEFVRLLRHDAIKYPVAGSKIAPGATQLGDLEGLEDEFDAEALADARLEMDRELVSSLGLDDNEDVKAAVWRHVSTADGFEQSWDDQHEELLFSVRFKQFVTLDEMPDDKEKIESLGMTIESNRQIMIRDAERAGKLEKKLEVRLGGYQALSASLIKKINDASGKFEDAKVEYESFTNLQLAEKAAIPQRVNALQTEVQRLTRREHELQQKYKLLSEEKDHILSGVV